MRYVDVLFALQTRRVLSVDALRGFSIFWIIGADGAIWTLDRMLRNKGPALNSVGSFLGTQMSHAEWVGIRFYDLIFPLFIFVTGVSIVLALPQLVEREGKARVHVHVLRRALLLYLLGIVFYGGTQSALEQYALCRRASTNCRLLFVCGHPVSEFLIGAVWLLPWSRCLGVTGP